MREPSDQNLAANATLAPRKRAHKEAPLVGFAVCLPFRRRKWSLEGANSAKKRGPRQCVICLSIELAGLMRFAR